MIKLDREFAKAQILERERVRREKDTQRRRATVDRLEALGFVAGKHYRKASVLSFSKQVIVEEKPGVHRNLYDVMRREYA